VVAVRSSGGDYPAFGDVFEYDDTGDGVMVDDEVIATLQEQRRAVGAVELSRGVSAFDVPRIVGNGDDVVAVTVRPLGR